MVKNYEQTEQTEKTCGKRKGGKIEEVGEIEKIRTNKKDEKTEKTEKIIEFFEKRYPSPLPKLKFSSEYELLVAVILSAQCTDARVNLVTAELFKNYNTPEKMLELTSFELEKMIFSCGLYRSKAAHILSASADIVQKFGGRVPSDFNDLISLAGVGRKTANVVSAVAFSKQAIAVDTHVFRVANRLGLAHAKTPLETEKQLNAAIPQNKWSNCHHYLIFYGREVCSARSPRCGECGISKLCEYYLKNS